MASRKPKPVEVKPGKRESDNDLFSPKPISLNPNADHKPEDELDMDLADSGAPVELTLEEARAEDEHKSGGDSGGKDSDDSGPSTPARIKLKWTDAMKHATVTAINDYLQSAGAMPSILDLFEILLSDKAFAHLEGHLNHKGVLLFSPQSLQAGVNAIRKQTAKDIAADVKANGSTSLIPLPSLARVQVERTKRVTDTRALSQYIANLPALRAKREEELAADQGNQQNSSGDSAES